MFKENLSPLKNITWSNHPVKISVKNWVPATCQVKCLTIYDRTAVASFSKKELKDFITLNENEENMIIFLLIFYPSVGIYIRWRVIHTFHANSVSENLLLLSPWQQPLTWAEAAFALWSRFDFYLVNAINVDKHIGWLRLEIIPGSAFHVCFGSLLVQCIQWTQVCYFMFWWNGLRGLLAFGRLAFTLYW